MKTLKISDEIRVGLTAVLGIRITRTRRMKSYEDAIDAILY